MELQPRSPTMVFSLPRETQISFVLVKSTMDGLHMDVKWEKYETHTAP